MSTEYSVEEVRDMTGFIWHYTRDCYPAHLNCLHTAVAMLTAYAADLDRRADGVTDELVKRALDIFVGGNQYTSEYQCNRMRAALTAVWPVAAEPSQPADSGRGSDSMVEAGHEAYLRTTSKPIKVAMQEIIRAALAAQGQGEAVAYFSADPAEGEFSTHKSLAEAVAGAESLLAFAQDVASDDGWADEPPQICYGVVLGGCVEKEGSRRPAPEGSDFAEMVDFRLTEPSATPATAASPAGVPDGWVPVPREPTPQMLAAVEGSTCSVRVAEDDYIEYPFSVDECAEIYRNMLAAAQSAPEGDVETPR